MATRSRSSRRSKNVTPNSVYSQEQTVVFFTDFILRGLPLNFGEDPTFISLLESLNPNFGKVKRKTLIEEINKNFVKLKKELHSTFASLTHKISLACDVWHNACTNPYVRVTASWIDSDWLMQKRVITFKFLFPLDPPDMYECIVASINEWGIGDKVFSVTFDDVSDSPEVIEGLENVLRPILDGRVFHGRCVCRNLISCIEDAWKIMSPIVTKIRKDISVCEYTHHADFAVFCEKYGLDQEKLRYDDGHHWDSIRDMLKICLPYKDAINEFVTEHWAVAESKKTSDEEWWDGSQLENFLMTEQEWEIASVICRVLDVFSDAVDGISSTYNPSSSGVLIHLVNIAKMFSEYRENVVFKQNFSVMEETFLNHFDKIPVLYCVAAVMDPRIKLSGCESLLESFYQCTGNVEVNVDEQKREVSNLLHEMYNLYVSQAKSPFPSSGATPDFGSNSFAWSVVSYKRQKMEDSAISELISYLQRPQEESFQNGGNKEFNILGWWKAQEIAYPILATMARDLLTIAVSSLTPDCAFVLNEEKRILEETPYHLTKTLEIYTCVRDWLHAETRTQGKRKEIEDEQLRVGRHKELEAYICLRDWLHA